MDKEEILQEEGRAKLLEEAHARRFLYKDLEELLEFGFLTQEATFGDAHVVFRSLTPGEVRKCNLRSPSGGSFLRWCISTSVWMLDGFEVSHDPKDNGAWHIYKDWASELTEAAVIAYATFFLALRNRMHRALRLVEAYCYEDYSRGLWRLLGKPCWGGGDVNTVRRIWVSHNLSEDLAKAEDARWHHTRMFVGSMSAKAAKELTRYMEKHEASEKAYRKKVIENTVNWVIRGDEPEPEMEVVLDGKKIKIKKIYSPTSVEDLEEEMHKLFTGEQDFHDSIVEAQNQRVRDAVETRRRAQEEAIEEARRKLDEQETISGGAPLVGYTKEQLEQLNPNITKKRGTDTYSGASEAHRLFESWVRPKIVPGVMDLNMKPQAPDASDPRLRKAAPEEAAPSPPLTLQEKLSARKPGLIQKPSDG